MSSSSTETTLVDVAMPQMGVSVVEGTVVEWKKQPGDWVEADEIIASISTDKIDTDVESPATGRVQEIIVEVGSTVEVGTVMARIATDAKPGEAHASESDSASCGGTSEAEVAQDADGDAGELQGDTAEQHTGHRPARLGRGAAQRRPPLLAGRDADRRRARHRPRAGRGHRPRRARAQAGRARVHGVGGGNGAAHGAADAHREPVPARRARRAAQAEVAARPPGAEAGARAAPRGVPPRCRPGPAARSRACASRSAAT